MSIQNKQLENAPKKQVATGTPSTLTGEGAFFVKLVEGVAEGFFVDDEQNETQITNMGELAPSPTSRALEVYVINGSGGSLAELAPVTLNSSGQLIAVDVSNEAQVKAFMGLVRYPAVSLAKTTVIVSGTIEDITTSATFGEILYVSKIGNITDVAPDIGVGGFVAGDFIVKIGKILQNPDDSAQKDFLVSPELIGQL